MAIGRPSKAKKLTATQKVKDAAAKKKRMNSPLGKALRSPEGILGPGTMKDKMNRSLAKGKK